MKALERKIKDLEARVRAMEARIGKATGGRPAEEEEISPNEMVEIGRIARARARGDKGPLREWNRRQRARYG